MRDVESHLREIAHSHGGKVTPYTFRGEASCTWKRGFDLEIVFTPVDLSAMVRELTNECLDLDCSSVRVANYGDGRRVFNAIWCRPATPEEIAEESERVSRVLDGAVPQEVTQ